MKYIRYFETFEEYESWINVEENAEEAYRTEEKICVDGIILSLIQTNPMKRWLEK